MCKNQEPLILNGKIEEGRYVGLYEGSLFLFSLAVILALVLYPLPLAEKVEKV